MYIAYIAYFISARNAFVRTNHRAIASDSFNSLFCRHINFYVSCVCVWCSSVCLYVCVCHGDVYATVWQVRTMIQQRYQQQQQQLLHRHHRDTSRSECRPNPPLLLLFDDAVCLLLFASEAFLWRGVWNLNATFLIADPCLGGWVNHAAGTAVLMLLQLFSYVGVCGCARDDDVPSDEGTN